jgi:hypothetical protein
MKARLEGGKLKIQPRSPNWVCERDNPGKIAKFYVYQEPANASATWRLPFQIFSD